VDDIELVLESPEQEIRKMGTSRSSRMLIEVLIPFFICLPPFYVKYRPIPDALHIDHPLSPEAKKIRAAFFILRQLGHLRV